jgi:Co/Zn/Cd efflux system component
VAILNLAYFGVEFAIAIWIGSVSLFADSIDFLEDASLSVLVLLALGWSARQRVRVGLLLAAILLVPSVASLWMAWQKFGSPIAPEPVPLTATGVGALAVNLACALMLSQHRHNSGSMMLAAFLSARNDVIANMAIIAAGMITIFFPSSWPDMIVGLGIVVMNIGAAREVYLATKREGEGEGEIY